MVIGGNFSCLKVFIELKILINRDKALGVISQLYLFIPKTWLLPNASSDKKTRL